MKWLLNISIISALLGLILAISFFNTPQVTGQAPMPPEQKAISEETTNNVDVYLIQPNEQPSPADRIDPSQIHIYPNKVVIDIPDAYISAFTDTNSMEPVIDIEANALQIKPQSKEEIRVGDIISYNTNSKSRRTIHRVVEIGTDEQGWYCKTKGDNLDYVDPYKIRFSDIQRIVFGIIY